MVFSVIHIKPGHLANLVQNHLNLQFQVRSGCLRKVPQGHDLPERDSASPTQGAARLYIDNDGDRPSTKGYNMWPEKLLPAEIPNTRIFTWGYDADVNGLLSSASQNTIHDHANNLLSDLDDLRSSEKDIKVPIIFVVHSLGGIVVKDALNRSSSEVGTRLKHIAPATFGIIFLGTPHRGSKSASIGKIANQISLVASKRPNLRLLQGLERKSEILDRIGDAFRQTILKHNISLYSFREEKETRRLGIFSTIVGNFLSSQYSRLTSTRL